MAARPTTGRLVRPPPHFVSSSTLIFRLCDEDEDEPLDLDPLACEPARDRPLVAGRPVSRGARPCGLDAIARAAQVLAGRVDRLVRSAHGRALTVGAHGGDPARGVVLPSQPGGPIELDSRADDWTHAEGLDEARADSDTAPLDRGMLFASEPADYERAGRPIEAGGAFTPSLASAPFRKARLVTPRRILVLGGVAAVWLLVVGLAHGSHTPHPVTDSRPSASTAPAREAASAAIAASPSSGRRSVSPPPAARPREGRRAPVGRARVIPQRRRSYAPGEAAPTRLALEPGSDDSCRPRRSQVLLASLGAARRSWRSTVRGAAAVGHERRLVSTQPAAATLSARAQPAHVDVDVAGRWRDHRRVHRRGVRRRGRPRSDGPARHRPGHAVAQRHRRAAARQPARGRAKGGADGADAVVGASVRKAQERVRAGHRDRIRRRALVGSRHRRRGRALPARRAERAGAHRQLQRVARRALRHRHRSREER
jgi:hypothetical protein